MTSGRTMREIASVSLLFAVAHAEPSSAKLHTLSEAYERRAASALRSLGTVSEVATPLPRSPASAALLETAMAAKEDRLLRLKNAHTKVRAVVPARIGGVRSMVASGAIELAATWAAQRAWQWFKNHRALRAACAGDFAASAVVLLRSSRNGDTCLLADPLRFGDCAASEWRSARGWLRWGSSGSTQLVPKSTGHQKGAHRVPESMCLDAACIRCVGYDRTGRFRPVLCMPRPLSRRLELLLVEQRVPTHAPTAWETMGAAAGIALLLVVAAAAAMSLPARARKRRQVPPDTAAQATSPVGHPISLAVLATEAESKTAVVQEGPKSEQETPHDEAVRCSPPGLRGPPTSRTPPPRPRTPVGARTYSFARPPRTAAKSARPARAAAAGGASAADRGKTGIPDPPPQVRETPSSRQAMEPTVVRELGDEDLSPLSDPRAVSMDWLARMKNATPSSEEGCEVSSEGSYSSDDSCVLRAPSSSDSELAIRERVTRARYHPRRDSQEDTTLTT